MNAFGGTGGNVNRAAPATFTVGSSGGGGTFSGVISGAITLSKTGAGTLLLGGSNTFTGGTALQAGTLTFGNVGAIGTGTLTITGGSLNSSVANLANANNNVQNWNGSFGFIGTQNLNLGSGTVTFSVSPTVTVDANTLTVGGLISGSGYGLTKAGGGTLSLGGINSYSGTTSINGGVLNLANSAALPSGNLTFGGGVLQVNAANMNFSNNVFNSTAAISIDSNGQSATFAGTLDSSNTGGLTVKSTAPGGVLTLTGSNNYSGTTQISGGTLSVGAVGDTGSSNIGGVGNAITFGNGTTLQFTGASAPAAATSISRALVKAQSISPAAA